MFPPGNYNQNSMFMGALASQRSMFPGDPNPFATPMLEIPGLSGHPFGGMLSMWLQPLLNNMARSRGFTSLQFAGNQNLHDTLMRQDLFIQSQTAMQASLANEQNIYTQQLLGFSRQLGVPTSAQQYHHARQAAQDIASMSPILSMVLPDMFDSFHGIRGSSSMLAKGMHLGGRYVFDPVEGTFGMRGSTAGELHSRVYRSLYDNPATLHEMKGIGGARLGQMYDELQRRGLMGSTSPYDAAKMAVKSGSVPGMSVDNFEQMEKTSPGSGMDSVIQSGTGKDQIFKTEAARIASRLKEMTAAVSAMRDIFGDMGKPNAPMAELISGLQALTQGGLNNLSGQTVEKVVRNMQQLTRMTGMSMEGTMQLVARGGSIADSLGIQRSMTLNATTEAMAMGVAAGQNFVPGYGVVSKEEMIAKHQELGIRAGNSELAKHFGTIKYMEDAGVIKGGSELAALSKAIGVGSKTYIHDGKEKSVAMGMQSFLEIAARDSSMSINNITNLRNTPAALESTIQKYNLGSLAKSFQAELDIQPFMNSAVGMAIREGGGSTLDDKSRLSLENKLRKAFFDMGNETRNDPTKRRKYIESIFQEFGLSKGGNAADAYFTEMARVSKDVLGYNTLEHLGQTFDSKTLRDATTADLVGKMDAAISGVLSGFGRGGLARNLADLFMTTDGNMRIEDSLLIALGGQDASFVKEKLEEINKEGAYKDKSVLERLNMAFGRAGKTSPIDHIVNLQKKKRDIESKYMATNAKLQNPNIKPEEAGRLQEELRSLVSELSSATADATVQLNALGLGTGTVNAGDITETLKYARYIEGYIRNNDLNAADRAARRYIDNSESILLRVLDDNHLFKKVYAKDGDLLKTGFESINTLKKIAKEKGVSLAEIISNPIKYGPEAVKAVSTNKSALETLLNLTDPSKTPIDRKSKAELTDKESEAAEAARRASLDGKENKGREFDAFKELLKDDEIKHLEGFNPEYKQKLVNTFKELQKWQQEKGIIDLFGPDGKAALRKDNEKLYRDAEGIFEFKEGGPGKLDAENKKFSEKPSTVRLEEGTTITIRWPKPLDSFFLPTADVNGRV